MQGGTEEKLREIGGKLVYLERERKGAVRWLATYRA